jgi:NAD(P)H-flavin reductase
LQLSKWKELIAHTDSITDGRVPFLFFVHPKDKREMYYLLEMDRFGRPVCIDTEDELNFLNRFPSDMTFQTFLLDKENKVSVIGNPIYNTSVKELYLKQISGQSRTD